MLLQNIKISETKQSPTNTPGRNEGKSFNDLVASIKEKGVLMPILVRQMLQNEKRIGKWEVIAGNRRLSASKEAGLTEIPAQIVEMTDVEAREAQIVENLQREDIHPIDEGIAYRSLIATSKGMYEVKDVALKVGKSESYIKQRLSLTNLSEKSAKAFRDNKINISQATLLSRVEDEKIQKGALEKFVDYDWDVDQVREWIQTQSYLKAVANPKSNLSDILKEEVPNLFGDKTLGIDPVSYGQKIAKHIENRISESEKKGKKMVKISTHYGKPDMKGVLSRDEYKTLDSKEDKKNAKEQIYGIVAEGDDLGQVFLITTDKEDLKGGEKGQYGTYRMTAKEKAEKKKENEKRKKEKEKMSVDFQKAINKIKMPLSTKQLDALFDFAMHRCGFSYQQPACILLGLEPVMKKQESYGMSSGEKDKVRTVRDYEATLIKYANDGNKLKAIFALLIPHPNENYMSEFNKAVKKL